MLRLNVIIEAESQYLNPTVVVIKKNNQIHFCVDGRFINSIIVSDNIGTEPINCLLSKCNGSKYFTSLDFNESFWQIELSEESKQYTAFQFKNKTFVHNVVPYGLKNSHCGLMRALNTVLDDQVQKNTLIFIDDFLVIRKDFEDKLQNLESVLCRLLDAGMTLNITKTKFFKKQVSFLGYLVNEQGILKDPTKVDLILKFPNPRCSKDLHSFLGLCNFYSQFSSCYSNLISPLLPLVKKNVKWYWNESLQATFDKVKEQFLKTVILHHPNLNEEYKLMTDASYKAFGGVLSQFRNGEDKVILFLHRTLRNNEKLYSVYELELLALIFCLKKVKNYISIIK